MASISVPNPTILNTETSDVTKLTANDNAIVSGLTDGSKDITIAGANGAPGVTTLTAYRIGT